MVLVRSSLIVSCEVSAAQPAKRKCAFVYGLTPPAKARAIAHPQRTAFGWTPRVPCRAVFRKWGHTR